MKNNIIYEKHYPLIESEKICDTDNFSVKKADSSEHIPFDQFLEKIYKDVHYVPIPEKKETVKKFVDKAIEISQINEIDLKIIKKSDHVSANFYFFCSMWIGFLKELICLADDIIFRKDIDGFDIMISIDFYTHATYIKNRRIFP